jgi:hypothetical protein
MKIYSSTRFLLFGAPTPYFRAVNRINPRITRAEAGSNTSTVTLRVVRGDEKGSLKSETVKYGREKDCAGKDQQHIQKTDPSSRQRGP